MHIKRDFFRIRNRLKLSPMQIIAIMFALIILIGSLLLTLPEASRSGVSCGFVDALFTATTATCVTGLVTLGIQPITLQNRTINGYGIECRSNEGVGSISTLVDLLRAGTAVDCFTYKKPFGTISSPYRLTDFENYWHSAPVPIRAPYNPTDTLGVTQQGTLQLYYYVDIEGSTYGLGLKDLRFQSDSQQLSEYYFGILIYNSTTYAAATQDHKMGSVQQEGLDVTLTGVPQTTATYQMVPFFATQPITSASASFVGNIYPMIWAMRQSFFFFNKPFETDTVMSN